MKNYFVLLILSLLLANKSKAQNFDLELFPNQAFTSSIYFYVIRSAPGPEVGATYRLENTTPSRWIRDINPKVVKSTWTLDPTRIDHFIQTPSIEVGHDASIINDAPVGFLFNTYFMHLRSTKKPKATDTIIINARPKDTIMYNRTTYQTLDIPDFGGSGRVYNIPTPDGLQQIKLVLRDSNLSWLQLSRDSFALSRADSVRTVQMRFTSLTIGSYETYMATYRQYRAQPLYTLIRFNVKNATATQELLTTPKISKCYHRRFLTIYSHNIILR